MLNKYVLHTKLLYKYKLQSMTDYYWEIPDRPIIIKMLYRHYKMATAHLWTTNSDRSLFHLSLSDHLYKRFHMFGNMNF